MKISSATTLGYDGCVNIVSMSQSLKMLCCASKASPANSDWIKSGLVSWGIDGINSVLFRKYILSFRVGVHRSPIIVFKRSCRVELCQAGT